MAGGLACGAEGGEEDRGPDGGDRWRIVRGCSSRRRLGRPAGSPEEKEHNGASVQGELSLSSLIPLRS